MSTEARLTVLETKVQHIDTTLLELKQDMKYGFEQVNRRFDTVDKRFDAIDRKFDTVDNKFDRIESRMRADFLWIISMFIGLAGLIAHTQHWI